VLGASVGLFFLNSVIIAPAFVVDASFRSLPSPLGGADPASKSRFSCCFFEEIGPLSARETFLFG